MAGATTTAGTAMAVLRFAWESFTLFKNAIVHEALPPCTHSNGFKKADSGFVRCLSWPPMQRRGCGVWVALVHGQ